MNTQDSLHLAALLHDIGKFRQRAIERYKKHQEHSYEFVNEDFADFFAPCGDAFKNAIRHHHRKPDQLEHLIEKQVILADRLSAIEREDEEREAEDFVVSALVSPLSRLECATKEYRYPLTALNLEDRNTIIPVESVEVNRETYAKLWNNFKKAFHKATDGKSYTPAFYQTIGALLHKYTSRIPSGQNEDNPDSDISLYDHLRTTAAIAACIGRELSETEVDALLDNPNDPDKKICALIKGDISGIQNFLYHILSDGASNQLRGRSFYLQLLTEAIAHWVLRQLDLPITNLLLTGGGHFFILTPHADTQKRFDTLRQTISKKLWTLHNGELSCILAGISIKAHDFKAETFPSKWDAVSENIHHRKLKKWSEMGAPEMFQNLFEPHDDRVIDEQEVDEQKEKKKDPWQFDELGKDLRHATTLAAFEVPESPIPDKPKWRDAIKAFGLDAHVIQDVAEDVKKPDDATSAVLYRMGKTDFLADIEKYQWEGLPVSYDFRMFCPVIAHTKEGETADYDYLANASEGVKWLGALRMDVDDLGSVFKNKLEKATISRLATLSRELRIFFEGYVPVLCRQYNENREKQILELIYAGGDDLFLVGGWSALPEIAEQIRTEFRHFVTGDHVTLSGGIAIEHKKFPLYQFAKRSEDAENAAKSLQNVNAEGKEIVKDAITFLQKTMSWKEFAEVHEWHQKLLESLTGQNQLPRDILTRLTQIYSEKELKEHQWAWRSLYYFHRLLERYKYDEQKDFLSELKQKLNHEDSSQFREELIHVITRWTALRIRNKED